MWTRNYLKLVKLQPVTRYQSRLLIRWCIRWFYLKTLPECSTKVLIHKVPAGALGSMAAWRSHTWKKKGNDKTRNSPSTIPPTLIFPSYAPLTIRLLSNLMHLTSSSCPSRVLRHAPHSMSQSLMVLSELPLTTSLSWYCRQAMPLLWPFNVLTNSQELVDHTWKLGGKSQETNRKRSFHLYSPIPTCWDYVLVIKINNVHSRPKNGQVK